MDLYAFPMALSEAQCQGIPTVMYDLPYLELVRNGGGIVSVPQGDSISAANEIVAILNDEKRYKALSDAAIKCTDYYNDYNYMGAWSRAFNFVDTKDLTQEDYMDECSIIKRMYIQIYG